MTTIRGTAGMGAGIVLLAGLLAGCGDDGDDGDNGGGDASSFADQSYDDIKAAAIDAMGSLESVRVEADVTSQGQTATLDLSMDAEGNCTGTVAFGGISAEVLQADGGAWFKPSPELLAQQFPDQAPAATEFVGDSWVADTAGEVTSSNCDLESFIEQVTSDEEEESDTEVGELEELDGEDVVPLTFTNDSGDGSAYILAEGEHYITKFSVEGDEPGTVLFSEFDEPVETEAPADDEIVDLADFQG
jgi:hypothetical protein